MYLVLPHTVLSCNEIKPILAQSLEAHLQVQFNTDESNVKFKIGEVTLNSTRFEISRSLVCLLAIKSKKAGRLQQDQKEFANRFWKNSFRLRNRID